MLVYAHDATAGRKREIARGKILELWNTGAAVVSTQVLQELFVSLTQKIPMPIERRKARTILEDLCAWEVIVNDEQAVLASIDLQAKHRLSFGIPSFLRLRVEVEPLYCIRRSPNGLQVEGVAIVNPFEP